MSETIRFSIDLPAACSRKEARVLGLAAALCLRDAVGGKAVIHWPGEILLEDETAARAAWTVREGGVMLDIEADADRAPNVTEARIREALSPLAADFPANSAELVQRYCNHCVTLMKFVDAVYRGMPVYGFAFALDKYGGLMIMTQASRSVVTVYSGPAELAKDEPQQPDMPVMPRL